MASRVFWLVKDSESPVSRRVKLPSSEGEQVTGRAVVGRAAPVAALAGSEERLTDGAAVRDINAGREGGLALTAALPLSVTPRSARLQPDACADPACARDARATPRLGVSEAPLLGDGVARPLLGVGGVRTTCHVSRVG